MGKETEAKMSDAAAIRPGGGGRRRGPVVAILLLAAFLLVALVFVVLRQIRAGETNRLRLLAGFATQVEATVPDLAQRFINVVDRSETPQDLSRNIEHIPNVSLLGRPIEAGDEQEPGFQLAAEGPRINLSYVTAKKVAFRNSQRDPPQGAETGEAAGAVAAAVTAFDEAVARERSRTELPPNVAGEPPPAGEPDEVLMVFRAVLDLPAVVRPIVIPQVFDLLVLAREQGGTVLFQHGDRELKLAELSAAWEVRRPGLLESLRESWREDRPSEPSGHGTRVAETEIADVDHRTFVQPVTLHLTDAEGNPLRTHRWVAAGVISWERLLASSFTASPLLLFLATALFPLMLVVWPFLKIWLTSRHQPLTRLDVAALAFGSMFGVSLATLLFLDFVFQSELRQATDRQLERLSRALASNLETEIEDAAGQLAWFRENDHVGKGFVCQAGPRSCPGPRVKEAYWDWVHRELRAVAPLGTASDTPLLAHAVRRREPPAAQYLGPIHSVFWTNAAGFQRAKVPFHPDAVLRNDVGDRGYFRCHQPGPRNRSPRADVVELVYDRWPYGKRHRVCLESIRSKTTAGDLAVLSIPARLAPRPPLRQPQATAVDDEPRPVVALVTRLVSVTRPLLAPGFVFAVVRDDGGVVFHSDPRRNRVENFLKATGDDPVLRSMLREDRDGPVRLNYWGSLYLGHVHPLEELPWTLIALRDKQDLRTRNFELLYDFANPFLLYLLVANLFFAAFLWWGRRHVKYLWPSRAYTFAYRLFVLAAAPVLGLSTLLVAGGNPTGQAVVAIAVPLLTLGLAIAALRLGSPQEPLRRAFRGRRLDRARGLRRAHRSLREPGPVEKVVLSASLVLALVALVPRGGEGAAIWLLVLLTAATAYAYLLLRRSFEDQTTAAPYTAALAMVLLLGAVVPTVALFRLAESRQAQFLVQDTQRGLLQEAHRRSAALQANRGPLAESLPVYAATDAAFPAATAAAFFDSATGDPFPDVGSPPLWPYGRPASGDPGAAQAPRWMSRLLAARPMPLDELTLDPSGTDLSRFRYHGPRWRLADGRLHAELEPPPPERTPRDDQPWAFQSVLTSAFTGLGLSHDIGVTRFVLSILAGLLLGGLLVALPAFISHRVVLVTLAPNRRYAAIDRLLDQVRGRGTAARQFLVVTSLPDAVTQMAEGPAYRQDYQLVDFGRITDEKEESGKGERETETAPTCGEEGRSLLVHDFRPNLERADAAKAQIERLRKLCGMTKPSGEGDVDTDRARRRSILLLTSRQYHRLTGPVDASDPSSERAESRRLWGSFLARFNQRYARDAGKPKMFASWIDRLCYSLRHDEWPLEGEVPVEPDWYAADDRASYPACLDAAPSAACDWRKDRLIFLLEVVRRECHGTWRLQRVGIDIVRELFEGVLAAEFEGWSPPTEQQLVERIGFAALPYYQRVWDGCERGEKIVLHQLARHGIANPKNFDQLLDLLNKGLIVRDDDDPVLRPMNRSFAGFVRKEVRNREAWRWEEEEGVSAWSVWKWVLPVPLLLLGVFLFVTQQNAISNVLGLVVAVASLLPTAVNLYQHFRQALAEEAAGA
jgi:hypothetical protein